MNDMSVFPYQPLGTDGMPVSEAHQGMSFRDYVAVAAMQGNLASCNPGFVDADCGPLYY